MNHPLLKFRTYFLNFGVGLLGGLVALGIFIAFANAGNRPATLSDNGVQPDLSNLTSFARYQPEGAVNFVTASKIATQAVVHIKSTVGSRQSSNNGNRKEFEFFFPFPDFFDDEGGSRAPGQSSGSGVIITSDGYVVTNNHVVEGADKVEVTLNDNRSYTATVIATDPSTDLALLKVKENDLPFLKFGDSDGLQVGEWVLAVGNPFNLTSTVTAGIVSAKGRNINILEDRFKIESFIQTDAAVNPGNSGGALVATDGRLVGINTAIASRTGSFSGYSFAVPATIVRKVVDDLMKFGAVQRGFLGVSIQDVNAQLAEKENLRITKGIYIAEVNDHSAASEAGLKKGDVITRVGAVKVSTSSELQEQIGRLRPGDRVQLTCLRNGAEMTKEVILKNKSGDTKIVKSESSDLTRDMGAELSELSDEDVNDYKTQSGVKVQKLYPGKFRSEGMREGFVITQVDKKQVRNRDELMHELTGKQGAVLVEGVYPGCKKAAYAVLF